MQSREREGGGRKSDGDDALLQESIDALGTEAGSGTRARGAPMRTAAAPKQSSKTRNRSSGSYSPADTLQTHSPSPCVRQEDLGFLEELAQTHNGGNSRNTGTEDVSDVLSHSGGASASTADHTLHEVEDFLNAQQNTLGNDTAHSTNRSGAIHFAEQTDSEAVSSSQYANAASDCFLSSDSTSEHADAYYAKTRVGGSARSDFLGDGATETNTIANADYSNAQGINEADVYGEGEDLLGIGNSETTQRSADQAAPKEQSAATADDSGDASVSTGAGIANEHANATDDGANDRRQHPERTSETHHGATAADNAAEEHGTIRVEATDDLLGVPSSLGTQKHSESDEAQAQETDILSSDAGYPTNQQPSSPVDLHGKHQGISTGHDGEADFLGTGQTDAADQTASESTQSPPAASLDDDVFGAPHTAPTEKSVGEDFAAELMGEKDEPPSAERSLEEEIFGVGATTAEGTVRSSLAQAELYSEEDKDDVPEERKRLRRQFQEQKAAKMQAAQERYRQVEAQRQHEQEERKQMEELYGEKVDEWLNKHRGNIRSMLASLHEMVGDDIGWKRVGMGDLVTAAAVKKVYYKAQLIIHPDKVTQRGGDATQRYLANKLFHELQDAYNAFRNSDH